MMKQFPNANSNRALVTAQSAAVVGTARLWHKGRVPVGARMLGTTLFWGVTALSTPQAIASEVNPDRPPLPAMSLEDGGALSIWRNPASIGFDPDPSGAFLYGWPLGKSETHPAPSSFIFAGSSGPFGLGVAHKSGGERPDWTTIGSNLAIPLSDTFQAGLHLGWQIPAGPGNNFVTFDFGTGWRPLSWWGGSFVGYNMGVSGRHTGVDERFAIGTTFRPLNDIVEVGGAYHRYTDIDSDYPGYAEAVLKVNPIDGLTIRMSGDQLGTIGFGLEFGLGGAAVGAHTTRNFNNGFAPYALTGITAAPDIESIIPSKNTIPHVVMDSKFPYQPVRSFFFKEGESYLHMLGRLNDAATAKNTAALLVEIDWAPFSFAQIEEILAVFDKARANKKKVFVYIDQDANNAAYMLASGADKIYMNPAQQLMLVGLSAELLHFRETLDMIGVEPQFSRRSEYKTAAEAMTSTHASTAQQEQMNALLDDMSGRLVARIAQGRKKSVEDVHDLIDQGPFTAQEAIDKGLIDGLAYPDELKKKINKNIGKNARYPDSYVDTHSGWRSANEVAVIFIEGTITSGKSQGPGILGGGRSTGSETVREQIEEASRIPSIKAVILRVDSPGGSALASDEIWRSLQKLRKKMPVIVSMGGVAASGGYYVSAGANAIYAQHSTVTGSIGVIAGKFNLSNLYDKIGINYESYIRGRNASMFSMNRPFDEHEFATFDKMVGDIYAQFTAKVAKGRNLPIENVIEVAGGRVWSGTRAHGVKLVDEIGGFHDAIDRAKKEAKIPSNRDVKLITFGRRLGPEEALERMSVKMLQRNILGTHPRARSIPEIEMLRQMQAMGNERIWTLMPYTVEVR